MRTPFGQLLDRLLDARQLNASAFADLVGISSGQASRIINGTRLPPLEAVALWGQRLRLTEDEAKALSRAAAYEHAPEVVRAELADLRRERDALADVVRELEAKMSALEAVIQRSLTRS